MNITEHRNVSIDIMKAIGIIFMVIGHAGSPIRNWIYVFHMSLFFLVAGYCYSERYSKSVNGIKKFFVKKIKSLYLPCLAFNLSVLILHNFFVSVNLTEGYYGHKQICLGILKCLLFSGGENLSGAMWFLRTMFCAIVIYAVIDFSCDKVKKKEVKKTLIVTIFLICGWLGSSFPGGKYLNTLPAVVLIQLGFLAKKYASNILMNRKYAVPYLVFGLVLVTVLSMFGTISFNINEIGNPVYFLLCSVFGSIMCLGMALLLERTLLKNLLCYIGQNTLPIMMFHFICMKIVTLLQIVIYKKPIEQLAAFPYLYGDHGWWILYSIVGVMIPLLLHYGFEKVKGKICKAC